MDTTYIVLLQIPRASPTGGVWIIFLAGVLDVNIIRRDEEGRKGIPSVNTHGR